MEKEVDDTHLPRKEKKCQKFVMSLIRFPPSIGADISELFISCSYQFRNICSPN